MFNLGKDWPVYFLIGISVIFFIKIAFEARLEEKKKRCRKRVDHIDHHLE